MTALLLPPLGPTPTALLAWVLMLAAVGALVPSAFALLAPNLVDRRWPASERLASREQVWARLRGAIEATFVGLDLELSRALVDRMQRRKIAAGTVVIAQGAEATDFFIVESGEFEVSQAFSTRAGSGERIIRRLGPGSFFGELAILRRTTRTATVRAVADAVVLRLPAEEFLIAAAHSAADQHVLLRTVDAYLAEDRRRAAEDEGPA